LERVVGQEIVEGREHYLRFEVPTTWQEDNGMIVDSTCGYADKEGFRCGTGDAFSVFNILSRKKLRLKERPLVFMDDNHHTYNQIDLSTSIKIISDLVKKSHNYDSSLTILFHNSIFFNKERIDFINLYKKLLKGLE